MGAVVDSNRDRLMQRLFKLQKFSSGRCFEPTETCLRPTIRAHSIQNSIVLEQIQANGHVVMPKLTMKAGKPRISMELFGRNRASTFTGLCGEHDQRIFQPIDNTPIDDQDEQHLFLLAYRSVLRELHAVTSGAVKNQLAFQEKVTLGLTPGDIPTPEGLRALGFAEDAYQFYLYKQVFDDAFLSQALTQIEHARFFEANRLPTIAASALFSLDDIEIEDDVARVALNIYPSGDGVAVIFSFLRSHAPRIRPFIKQFEAASGDKLLNLVSARVLQSCENFALSPNFWRSIGKARQESIQDAFVSSLMEDVALTDHANLMLFSACQRD